MLAVIFSLLPATSLANRAVTGRAGMPWIVAVGIAQFPIGRTSAYIGLSTTAALVFQLFAVQRADVLIVAPIMATFPLWTLLLSHIFIARLEQITLCLAIGTVVTVAGVMAVVVGGQL